MHRGNSRRRGPSPALIVATIALVGALTGTAWALATNSVKSKHIVDGQVKARDLAGNAVQNAPIKGLEYVAATSGQIANNDAGGVSVPCPAGKVPIGGGFTHGSGGGASVSQSRPIDETGGPNAVDSWATRVNNGTGGPITIRVFAVCAEADGATGNPIRK